MVRKQLNGSSSAAPKPLTREKNNFTDMFLNQFFFPSPFFSTTDFITAWQDDSTIPGPEIPRLDSYTWNHT